VTGIGLVLSLKPLGSSINLLKWNVKATRIFVWQKIFQLTLGLLIQYFSYFCWWSHLNSCDNSKHWKLWLVLNGVNQVFLGNRGLHVKHLFIVWFSSLKFSLKFILKLTPLRNQPKCCTVICQLLLSKTFVKWLHQDALHS